MKALYLAPPRSRPGALTAFTHSDEEIRALAAAGVEAVVLSASVDRPVSEDGIRLVPFPPATTRARLRTLGFVLRRLATLPARVTFAPKHCLHLARIEAVAAEIARREQVDLIHSYFAWPGGFGGVLAAATARKPLLAAMRGMELQHRPDLGYGAREDSRFDAALRVLLRRADRLVYVSEHLRRLGEACGARPEAGTVVLKGVDDRAFESTVAPGWLRRELNLPDGPTVLTVAGLVPLKGIDVVLRALARASERHPASLVVCGRGPEQENLERLSAELGLTGRVRFTGWVARREIPLYFAGCDVFVLASHVEASGNSILEAMASGRPVVATAAGGPQEYVSDGETGIVVPVADHEAMAGAFGRLFADEGLRERMGRAGRERVERHFRYDRMVADLLAVYRELVSESPSGRS